jgi:hypothetical protein
MNFSLSRLANDHKDTKKIFFHAQKHKIVIYSAKYGFRIDDAGNEKT